jgi:hypothetical protein
MKIENSILVSSSKTQGNKTMLVNIIINGLIEINSKLKYYEVEKLKGNWCVINIDKGEAKHSIPTSFINQEVKKTFRTSGNTYKLDSVHKVIF